MITAKQLFRWKAIVPLTMLLLLIGVVWVLLLDRLVERSIESYGTTVVGARVDLESADVRVREGVVVLRGLQVTNPDKPMTNLIQADEIVADVAMRPLLEKKLVVDTMAFRGVRFGTARETSGAVDPPSETSRELRAMIDQWAGLLQNPALQFSGLASAVDIDAVSPDSLRSLQLARGTTARADSLRAAWEAQLAALDPRDDIDTARALVSQLRNFNPLRLGPTGVANLISNSRSTLNGLGSVRSSLAAMDTTTRAGMTQLRGSLDQIATAQGADLAYARGLLQLPTLDSPSLSTSVFGDAVVQWFKPVMYWTQVVERFVPPGLNPRRHPGAKRARREGTDVSFPGGSPYPRFLLRHGEVDVVIGGEGAAAGAYAALVQGLTTDPAVYGAPTVVRVGREGAATGPRSLRASAILDHVNAPSSDTLSFAGTGLGLPTFELPMVNGRLILGQGTAQLDLARSGNRMAASVGWTANAVTWQRIGAEAQPTQDRTIGSRAWAEALLWDAVSGLRSVQIDVAFEGTLSDPRMTIRSNVGDAIAGALRAAIGQEIQRAEQRLQEEVTRLVSGEVVRAVSAVQALGADVAERVGIPLEQVERVEAELREELRKLGRLP